MKVTEFKILVFQYGKLPDISDMMEDVIYVAREDGIDNGIKFLCPCGCGFPIWLPLGKDNNEGGSAEPRTMKWIIQDAVLCIYPSICDEVAKECCGVLWEMAAIVYDTDALWPEVCRRYGIEVGKATLAKASENAKLSYDDNGYPEFMPLEHLKSIIETWSLKVDKDSILNESNIVLP